VVDVSGLDVLLIAIVAGAITAVVTAACYLAPPRGDAWPK
jgi:hypothetical protein